MEVVIGFAFGYWVGTRQGRDGLARSLDSARAIWESPETKRLLKEGLTALEAAAPVVAPAVARAQKNRGGLQAVIQNVVDDLIERRHEQRDRAA
jgi:hypothetical protein